MSESSIHICKEGILFQGPDAVKLMCAITLRSIIFLLNVGIVPKNESRMDLAMALIFASDYTGLSYKESEAEKAMADLTVWIETMKSALPLEFEAEGNETVH